MPKELRPEVMLITNVIDALSLPGIQGPQLQRSFLDFTCPSKVHIQVPGQKCSSGTCCALMSSPPPPPHPTAGSLTAKSKSKVTDSQPDQQKRHGA